MTDFSDDPFVRLQQARKAHRHAAHVYANTKKGSNSYSVAVEQLENTAMLFAVAAMLFGAKADAAAPANGPARAAWEKAIDPEPTLVTHYQLHWEDEQGNRGALGNPVAAENARNAEVMLINLYWDDRLTAASCSPVVTLACPPDHEDCDESPCPYEVKQ